MNFTFDELKLARERGYSDDEIWNTLASEDKEISLAKQRGYSLEEVTSIVSGQPIPEPEPSGFLRQAADIPIQFAKGIGTGTRGLTDIFGADNPVSKTIAGYEDYMDDLLSAESKNDSAYVARRLQEAKDGGFLDKITVGLEAFSTAPLETTANVVGYMVPQLAAGVAGKAAQLGKAAQVGLTLGTSLAQGAGTAKGDLYQNTKLHLREIGVPEDQIEPAAVEAQAWNGKNLDNILGQAGLNAIASRYGAEAILTRVLTKQGKEVSSGIIGGILKGAGKEMPLEGLQGAYEEVTKNVGLQRMGYDVPTFQGAIESATTGIVAGGVVGGLAGGIEAISAEQKELNDIEKEANRKIRDLEADSPAAQALSTEITRLERGIDNKRQDLDTLESTSQEASKARLDIAADQKKLAVLKVEAAKFGLSEPIAEIEKQQAALAGEIAAPTEPTVKESLTVQPTEAAPAKPIVTEEPPVSMVGKEVIPGVTPIPVVKPKAPVEQVVTPPVEVAPAPAIEEEPMSVSDEKEFAELNDLMEKKGQAENKVRGVKFTKQDQSRYQNLVTKFRDRLIETTDPKNDPVVGTDINGTPIQQSNKGTFYTFENGRVRTGPSFSEATPAPTITEAAPVEPIAPAPVTEQAAPAEAPAPEAAKDYATGDINTPFYFENDSWKVDESRLKSGDEVIETSDGPAIYSRTNDGKVVAIGVNANGRQVYIGESSNSFMPSDYANVPISEMFSALKGSRTFESDRAGDLFPAIDQKTAEKLISKYPPTTPSTAPAVSETITPAAVKTRLDIILDEVENTGSEVSVEVPEKNRTREGIERMIKAANDRGLEASFEGRVMLFRPPIRPTTPEGIAVGNRIKLGRSPQTYTIEEVIPQTDTERANNEQYYSVKNDKTGETQVVEKADMKPVKAKGDVRLNPLGYDIADVVEDIKQGKTSTPLKAVNQVIKESNDLRKRVAAESARRQQPRKMGKAAILERIARERSAGNINENTAKALTDFINRVNDNAIWDTAISIRAKGVSNYDFADNLVTFFLNQDKGDFGASVGIHEFWHGLSRFLPDAEVEKINKDYTKELADYLKKNPWFLAFVGRYSLTPEQFEAYKFFNPKESETKLTPVKDEQGNIVKYNIKFDKDNYRYIMLDEFIAEKMTDLVLGKQQEPNTFLGKLAKVLREFMALIKARLGVNPYEKFYQAVTSTNSKLVLQRQSGVAPAMQIYDPVEYDYSTRRMELKTQDARFAELEARAKAGDKEAEAEAQRMVDEAAKAAGYDVGPVWHGSPDFVGNEFDLNMRGRRGFSRGGFSFTREKKFAEAYMQSGVDPSQKLVDEINSLMRELQKRINSGFEWVGPYNEVVPPEFKADAVDDISDLQGYIDEISSTLPSDLQVVSNELATRPSPENFNPNPRLIRVFLKEPKIIDVSGKELLLAEYPAQIKSADPFTYDDAGNLIPLSERFQPTTPDIRMMAVEPRREQIISEEVGPLKKTPEGIIAKTQELLRKQFDPTKVSEKNTTEAFRALGRLTSKQGNVFAEELNDFGRVEGSEVSMGAALFVNDLFEYSIRLAAEGDKRMLGIMMSNINKLPTGAMGATGAGQTLRARLELSQRFLIMAQAEQDAYTNYVAEFIYGPNPTKEQIKSIKDAYSAVEKTPQVTEQELTDEIAAVGDRAGTDLVGKINEEFTKATEKGKEKRRTEEQELDREYKKVQKQADAEIEKLAKIQSDTPSFDPAAARQITNDVRAIVANDLKQRPDMGRKAPWKSMLVAKLQEAGVELAAAETLADIVWRQHEINSLSRELASINKAIEKGPISEIVKAIKETPLEEQQNPNWRYEVMRDYLRRAGLPLAQAERIAKLMDISLQKRFTMAQEEAFTQAISKTAPWKAGDTRSRRAFQKVLQALRAGALDPARNVLSDMAALNGWTGFTPDQYKSLLKYDAILADPESADATKAEAHKAIQDIISKAKLPIRARDVIGQYYDAQALSGIPTVTVNIFSPAGVAVKNALTQALNGVVTARPEQITASLTTFIDSIKSWANTVAFSFKNNVTVYSNVEYLVNDEGLLKLYNRGVDQFNNGKTPRERADGVKNMMIGMMDYVRRVLNALDYGAIASLQNQSVSKYALAAMQAKGMSSKDGAKMLNAMMEQKRIFYNNQIAIGTDKNKAAVLADEYFISAWRQALTDAELPAQQVMDAALNDAMSAVGRNRQSLDAFREEETNIRDNGVTSFPAIWLLETMANAANRQDSQFIKIFSRIIYGFAIVPARVLRETAWFSPYGAVRFAYDAIAKKMGKTSPYAQSLGNDLQYRQRLTETITGSIVMLAFAAAMSASTEDEEDKKPFKIVVTGNGPLRNEDPQFYDSWMKKNKANTVNVYFGKTKFTINTMRGFEAFAWPAMMLGAVDDWHIRKKQKRTTNTPLQMQDAAIVAGNVLSASLRRGPYAFAAKPLFEAYGDRGVESLAKSLAFPAKTIIPVLGSSLASNISNFLNEPVDRRTLEGALWSNIPFIGPTVAPKSLNAFGEPSLSTDMASKIFKLGVPIVYDIPTDRNSIMVHELVLKQGGGPSIPNRSQVAKRLDREPTNKEFEMFVKEYGAEIKRVMSENIEELSAMSGPDYDRAMEYIGNNARDAAQVKLMEAK
jgi:hypothetical protein